jgi:arogenate/prephenate dehydratase
LIGRADFLGPQEWAPLDSAHLNRYYTTMKAAFQGVPGAYSEIAARKTLGPSCLTVPCNDFEDVFDAVASRRVDRGVIPIENSLAGSIHENYDHLVKHHLHIIGETHLRIEHALLARHGATLRAIKEVRSHPQALAQCSHFFARHPHAIPVSYFDTAGAARSLGEETGTHTAAIASIRAARLYGLSVVRRHIENSTDNFTRFLVISRTPVVPPLSEPAKCSISFTPVANRPGILFRILGVFSLRDIDLTKIESRPDPSSPFTYRFYLDFVGNPREPRTAKALDHLREIVKDLRLLGAYPAAHR